MCSQNLMQAKELRRTSEGRGSGKEGGHLADSSAPSAAGLAAICKTPRVLGSSPGPWPYPTPPPGKPRPRPSRFWSRLLRPPAPPPPQPLFFRPFSLAPPPLLRLCTSNHLLQEGGACTAPVWLTGPATSLPWARLPEALVRLGVSIKIRMVVGFHGVWQLLSPSVCVRLCATP